MRTYMTARGAKKLGEELRELMQVKRPQVVREVADAAAQGDRSENAEYIYGKKRLREIDRRVQFLTRRLDDAVVVSPDEHPRDAGRVFFGAHVWVTDEDDQERYYQVVGPDEAEPDLGLLSYESPLGRVLMGKRLGEEVVFRRPAGEQSLVISRIEYGELGEH